MTQILICPDLFCTSILRQLWVRADLNARLNTNFCVTWCWWERGGAALQVSQTSGEVFLGKAAVSSFLKTELKLKQSAT